MRFTEIDNFLARSGSVLRHGPVAVVFAEDMIEIDSTLRHVLGQGFDCILLLAPPEVVLPALPSPKIHLITLDVFRPGALFDAMNQLIPAAPGQWFHYSYNAEYLHFPFCESRSVTEMLAFHTEERREAMLCQVIDLYARDLTHAPDGVDLENAMLDTMGYHGTPREDPENDWRIKERQFDMYGGLRWRFEEFIPFERRKIDRIALFRAKADLRLHPDHTFNDEEYNTCSCPWHHNLTAAICSFRTAKALKTNPATRTRIPDFNWRHAARFDWSSQQLMDLGLMEPGQWF